MNYSPFCSKIVGLTEKIDHVRASEWAKSQTVSLLEDLDTRSMKLQPIHSSQHITIDLREQVLLFSRASTDKVTLKPRARIGSSSSRGVGIDAGSTMVELLCISGAPSKSQPMHKFSSPRRPQCTERRQLCDWMSLPFATALLVALRTWTGTCTMSLCMSPSRSRCRRPTTARTRGTSDKSRERRKRRAEKVPTPSATLGSRGRHC